MLIALYSNTFDERWINEARALADQRDLAISTILLMGIFHFTSDLDPALIARPNERHDNVIPASNSSMAKALFQLGHLFDDEGYLAISRQLMGMMAPRISTYPTGHSNWHNSCWPKCSPTKKIPRPSQVRRRLPSARDSPHTIYPIDCSWDVPRPANSRC